MILLNHVICRNTFCKEKYKNEILTTVNAIQLSAKIVNRKIGIEIEIMMSNEFTNLSDIYQSSITII